MTVIVQRSYEVELDRQDEFERLCAEQRWPELQAAGVTMTAYGVWTFGGRADSVCAQYVYADFAHLEEVHGSSALAADLPESFRGIVRSSSARVLELSDGLGGIEATRTETGVTADPPRCFGRGSVISERSYLVAPGSQPEFLRLSHDLLWPWLEGLGARRIGFGHDPFGASDYLVTLFAFRSLGEWYRLSRPEPGLGPPAEMVEAWQRRTSLIQRHSGRLLTVNSDFGVGAS